jgi:hypothetical protein
MKTITASIREEIENFQRDSSEDNFVYSADFFADLFSNKFITKNDFYAVLESELEESAISDSDVFFILVQTLLQIDLYLDSIELV